jgi:urea transport system permease protein
LAGVALSQIDNVSPNLGQSYIIDSFMVVVFGGVGNLWGTLISAMTLGIANKLLEPYAGAVLGKIACSSDHPVHPEAPARPVRAEGQGGGSMITRFLLSNMDKRRLRLPRDRRGDRPAGAAGEPFAAGRLALPCPTTATMSLWGKYLCYALLAISLDLIWGYCGILSLGHGAFFALGGYAMGMYLMRQIGSRGVYGNPVLPDFMVFLNWGELPWYWWGFSSFPFAMLMVLLVPGLLAFVFGWFAFRSRVTGVYLSIITQALTYALLLAFFRNDMGFGGNNGLTDFKDILGFNVQAQGTRAALFAMTCTMLIAGFLIARGIVTSKLGKVVIAIRDAESRTRFLGYRVDRFKLFVFTASACMAGVAGRSTCRRSASSIPANSRRPTRSRR